MKTFPGKGSNVDEHDWIASDDPQRMLQWLTSTESWADTGRGSGVKPSDRRLRLFTCAVCRQVWDQLSDPRSRKAVEVAERYVDGEATQAQFDRAHEYYERHTAHHHSEVWLLTLRCFWSARYIVDEVERSYPYLPPALQAALLRDLVGNPWHLTTLGRMTSCNLCFGHTPDVREGCCHVPFRLTPTVQSIARRAYDEHCPADSLAVLADALEDAGADCAPLLEHLRGPGPHARGCWAVDLVLGKG